MLFTQVGYLELLKLHGYVSSLLSSFGSSKVDSLYVMTFYAPV